MFVGENPDEPLKGADRRIARLVAVHRQTVAGHQPQPRRLPVPAADQGAHRSRDGPDQIARTRQRVIGVSAIERALPGEDDHPDRRKLGICRGFREGLQHRGLIAKCPR